MTEAFATPDTPSQIFFIDWPLWAKMTFVLAAAIVVVFMAGLCKLWYMRRFIRKHEVLDEEKQVKIQQMRQSGIEIINKKGDDTPFGVRALESGVSVDGIYTERNSLKASREAGSSSGSFVSTIAPSLKSLDLAAARSPGSSGSSTPTQGGTGLFPVHVRNVSDGQITPSMGSGAPVAHASYKPRRSSQLRFSSYGDTQYHGNSLAQLEGRASPVPRTHRPKGTPNKDRTVDSSSDAGADNERNSSTSDESDSTLTDKQHSRPKSAVAFDLLNSEGSTSVIKPRTANPSMGRSIMKSYGALPTQSPEEINTADPFSAQFLSHTSEALPQWPLTEASSSSPSSLRQQYSELKDINLESEVPLMVSRQSASSPDPTFGPGRLHVNKSVRKSNSGFVILPAGTFGARAEFQPVPQSEEDSNKESTVSNFGLKRASKRLSKQRPASLKAKGRTSSTFGDRA